MCRKIATAKLTGEHEIEIWGDGEQTRSFCYIDDCVEGIYRLMRSDYAEPLNLGQDRMVSINELADIDRGDCRRGRSRKRHVARPAGRARPQLRQHAAAPGARLGAGGHARGWPRLDLRVDRAVRSPRVSSSRTPSRDRALRHDPAFRCLSGRAGEARAAAGRVPERERIPHGWRGRHRAQRRRDQRGPIADRRARARRSGAGARGTGAPGHDEHPRSDRRDRRHLHHRPDAQRRDAAAFRTRCCARRSARSARRCRTAAAARTSSW